MSAYDELEAALTELKEMVKKQTQQVDQLDKDVRQFFAELGQTQMLKELNEAESRGQGQVMPETFYAETGQNTIETRIELEVSSEKR